MADTTKNKNSDLILIIVIAVLALTFIGILIYNHFKNKDEKTTDIELPPPNGNTNTTTTTANDNFPLTVGSKGANVKYLQQAMNKIITNSALKVTEDGIFGQKTYNSLVAGVGTTTYWETTKIPTYPVSQNAFNSILKRANSNLRMMNGNIYQFTS